MFFVEKYSTAPLKVGGETIPYHNALRHICPANERSEVNMADDTRVRERNQLNYKPVNV